MFGEKLLYSALNSVVFHKQECIQNIHEVMNKYSTQQIAEFLKNDWQDSYRFGWNYLELVADRIEEFNQNNMFCPFSRKRNLTHLSLFRRVIDNYSLHGARVLDFGCGAQAAYSMAAVFSANGARTVYATDLAEADNTAAVKALNKLIIDMFTSPEDWTFRNPDLSQVRAWATTHGVFKGDIVDLGGVLKKANIHHIVGDASLSPHIYDINFVFSVSVLEHVTDIPKLCEFFSNVTAPEGMMCHCVDFSRHGSMFSSSEHPWYHLTQSSPVFGVNGLRLSSFIEHFERAGFSVEVERTIVSEPPSVLREQLDPIYAECSDDDLNTFQATLICRKNLLLP